jgi:dienelactone hydrolase
MKILPMCMFSLASFATPADAEIKGQEISYRAGDTTLKGYMAINTEKSGPRPGVLVVHEFWGQNEYVQKRARMLAELGYAALAVDIYGDGKTAQDLDEARKYAGEIRANMPMAKDRFLAAMALLKSQPEVDSQKIAAIGYCFGGGVALAMARMGVDLTGVASFHGSLATENPAKKGDIKGKLLILNGADDPLVPSETIASFKQEMTNAEVDFTFIDYPGAKHAFTNPDADRVGQQYQLPVAYNETADHQSWDELQKFLKAIFK